MFQLTACDTLFFSASGGWGKVKLKLSSFRTSPRLSSLLAPGSCLQILSRICRVRQSHCLSIFHRVLLTRALALSASQVVHKKKSQRIYSSMHSAGLEVSKLTYTRLEDNLIRHRGDRWVIRPRRKHGGRSRERATPRATGKNSQT